MEPERLVTRGRLTTPQPLSCPAPLSPRQRSKFGTPCPIHGGGVVTPLLLLLLARRSVPLRQQSAMRCVLTARVLGRIDSPVCTESSWKLAVVYVGKRGRERGRDREREGGRHEAEGGEVSATATQRENPTYIMMCARREGSVTLYCKYIALQGMPARLGKVFSHAETLAKTPGYRVTVGRGSRTHHRKEQLSQTEARVGEACRRIS